MATVTTTEIDTLKCKLGEYVSIYASKVMWGMDCDIQQLRIEINKIKYYIEVFNSLLTPNDCNLFPIALIRKIKNYVKAINRKRSSFCKNC